MKAMIAALVGLLVLTACGVDGEPVKPSYSTKTTIGYNSRTGAFNKTTIGITIGNQ